MGVAAGVVELPELEDSAEAGDLLASAGLAPGFASPDGFPSPDDFASPEAPASPDADLGLALP